MKRIGIVLLVTIGLWLGTAGPAQAAGTFYYTTTSWGRAGWNPTTNQLRIEDRACDGFAVYAKYDWGGISDTPKKLWDHNCYAFDGPVTVKLTPPAGVGSIGIKLCKWYKDKADPCPASEGVIVTHR